MNLKKNTIRKQMMVLLIIGIFSGFSTPLKAVPTEAYPDIMMNMSAGASNISQNRLAEIFQKFMYEVQIHRSYVNPMASLFNVSTVFDPGILSDGILSFASFHLEGGFLSFFPSTAQTGYGFYTGRALVKSGLQLSVAYALYHENANSYGFTAGLHYGIANRNGLKFGAGVFGDYLYARVPQLGAFNVWELRIPVYASLSF